ncbi:MAG: alpha/beta fold hydrolase [Bacteroidales bacterium]|jgi:esterase|nr:alpha/beta fold hydrolase [Bacteroidales bacterium]
MKLFFRKYGQGPPLIIIHGLYGSSDNWVSIGRKLAYNFEVFIIDQRNHGKSPHSVDHNYQLLKADLLEFMDSQSIDKAIIIGHSMGGKTAMFFAADYPERVSHLIVVDISPKSYKSTNSNQLLAHTTIIRAMYNLDFYGITSRQEIDDILSKSIPENRIRQFLLKNIKRSKNNEYSWTLNIKTIKNELINIMDGLNSNQSEITGFPVLFIKGGNSDYILNDDKKVINQIFPFADIETIPNAGHWLHAEQPELFLAKIEDFILQ